MKRALIRVSIPMLEDILKGKLASVTDVWTDAPADLRVVGIDHAPAGLAHLWFYVLVESETFETVSPGKPIPEHPGFTYRRRDGVYP